MGKHKAGIYIAITLAGIVLIAGVYQSHKRVRDHKLERLHDEQFHKSVYSDFQSQLERRGKINDLVEYNKEKEENKIRFAKLKSKPQVIWGKITTVASKDLGFPLRMRLRKKRPKTPSNPALNRTVVDDQLRFAFAVAEPGEYEVILYETSTCPGVRLENLIVKDGQPMPETVIRIEDETIEVTARDSKGNFVVGGQVTVGKSDGGTNSNLFTWRKGLTDSKGKFFAENLMDGRYVVVVRTQRRNGSASVKLNTNEHKKINITMTHDNY